MRILIITNLFPDARQPRFGAFVANHAAALAAAGADLDVAAIRGVPVHSRIAIKYLRLAWEASGKALWASIRGRRPRVVESHIAYPTGLIAWPIARALGAKLVLYCHGSDVTRIGVGSKWHHRLARFVLRRADLVVTNSHYIESVVHSRYGVARDRIVVWSPGIDTRVFKPLATAVRDPREVLFVGRLDEQKGLAVLFEAVDRIGRSALTVRIIGDGPDRQALHAAAERLGIAVRFDGPLDAGDVAAAMARTGVLVVPSISAEGLGLVALEGMATGALVVASATGGLAETVEPDVTGWLVAPGDADALAMGLSKALELAGATQSASAPFRQAARERAAQHDIWMGAQTSLRKYRQLLSGQ
jgi:glycosyltransferase involved in cell wall biosynthesis